MVDSIMLKVELDFDSVRCRFRVKIETYFDGLAWSQTNFAFVVNCESESRGILSTEVESN